MIFTSWHSIWVVLSSSGSIWSNFYQEKFFSNFNSSLLHCLVTGPKMVLVHLGPPSRQLFGVSNDYSKWKKVKKIRGIQGKKSWGRSDVNTAHSVKLQNCIFDWKVFCEARVYCEASWCPCPISIQRHRDYVRRLMCLDENKYFCFRANVTTQKARESRERLKRLTSTSSNSQHSDVREQMVNIITAKATLESILSTIVLTILFGYIYSGTFGHS